MSEISQNAWAILDTRWGSNMLFYGASRTRLECITDLLWTYYGDDVESRFVFGRGLKPKQRAAWNQLYRSGYRCVRVRVTVVST